MYVSFVALDPSFFIWSVPSFETLSCSGPLVASSLAVRSAGLPAVPGAGSGDADGCLLSPLLGSTVLLSSLIIISSPLLCSFDYSLPYFLPLLCIYIVALAF